jgi:hypothetical protein
MRTVGPSRSLMGRDEACSHAARTVLNATMERVLIADNGRAARSLDARGGDHVANRDDGIGRVGVRFEAESSTRPGASRGQRIPFVVRCEVPARVVAHGAIPT